MRLWLWLILLTMTAPAWGKGDFPGGVAFDIGFGMGTASIENPNNTTARYKMLNVDAMASVPLFERSQFSGALVGGLRYLDLENTANSSAQSEVANMIGPGVGLRLRGLRFFAGIDYHFMLARHYAVGTLSSTTKYEMPLVSWNVGYALPLKAFVISISYSQSQGSVPKNKTQLSRESPYKDQVYWLRLTYSTGQSFSKFFSFLF